MTQKQRLVIIGNGMAGARFIEEVVARQGNEYFDIVVFGDEPYGNYNRILLSGVLAGTHDPQDIFINPLAWYKNNNVTLHSGSPVTRIDTAEKMVYADNGTVEHYDKLVIATGSAPFIPPMKNLYKEDGQFREGLFIFRTLDDCESMTNYSSQCDKAIVIGGGLLGLEAARGLLNRGLEVHVIHLLPQLMNVQLDPAASEMLHETLRNMGVHLHLEKNSVAALGSERFEGLLFSDGSVLEGDMCVISAGIRPNITLAKEASIHVERGIVIADDLSTSTPDIYAIGECTQHRGCIYGLVAPLWEQARCLADLLTNKQEQNTYQGSKVSTKLKVMGVELAVMGAKERTCESDEIVTYSEPSRGIYKKLIVNKGRLVGAIMLGENATTPRLLQLFDREEVIPENRAELLFPLSGDAPAFNVADLPDDAQICNCNGVSKGQIVAAVKSGKRSLKMLCDATRAGTGCGSCKSQVQALLEFASDGVMVDDPSIHYYVPGVPLAKPQLIEAIKQQNLRSVSAVFQALAGGKEDAGSKVGLASLLKTIWGKDYEDERDARFINDRVHANIQNNGTFSVVPRIYGGVTTPEQLRRIADVADKYKVPMVKITGGQRIDLLGIPKDKLPEVWKELDMPSGHAYTKSFRTCKTCVGSEFCRYGVGDSTGLGIKIEKRFQGIESPHKMKLATTGCPRNCSEATTKDLGAVAIEGGKWEIYIGGAAGSQVRKGDVLCTVGSHDEVLLYMGRFMQYYRENAKYLERTWAFVERLGIDHLRQLLVEDSEGICQRLDEAIQASVDAYVDPWQEAVTPATPTQFSQVLNVVEKIPALS
ncbi:nitrite reductase [NAD(P)H] [Reticulibacter mediterranei]|uniref:Nitrite reductase [NAD(P)H] n=1 Tax=Reticulibacter mediterranei TaxID=2778369 RepID=A0A8J3N1U8_9CHLR|nr:nitrite reductase large subunit NirB [Reticulibacter mediterranei]GHO95514.1 nitrite reductase [NAD(P)H] [Reticulibacter mediterranei]